MQWDHVIYSLFPGKVPALILEKKEGMGAGNTKWFAEIIRAILMYCREGITYMRFEQDKYRQLLENLPDGFAYHQVVTFSEGCPLDFVFLHVNTAFAEVTGLSRDRIVGRRVTEVFPGIMDSAFDWIGTYGQVARTGEAICFEQYFEFTARWYVVKAYSDKPGYFAVVLQDKSADNKSERDLMSTARLAGEFLHLSGKDLDYQRITDHLLDIYEKKQRKIIKRVN